MVNVFELDYEVFYLESMINSVTQGVKATPITKGALGRYKCKQNIIERDKNLLENMELIQKHMNALVEKYNQLCEEES